jgi:HlyD family secretion protein
MQIRVSTRPRSTSRTPISATPWRREALVVALINVLVLATGCSEAVTPASADDTDLLAETRAVSSLGRLEPRHGIIRVSASSVPDAVSGAVLATLLVDVGDDVTVGDLLAVTDTEAVLVARAEEIKSELVLAQRESEATQSLAAAACVRAGVALREADRLTSLRAQDLASEEATDRARGAADAGAADCTAAESAAKVADAAIRVVAARLKRNEVEFERSRIRAPITGKVLAVNTRPGELIDADGILELGDVRHMYAIAEVYETDVRWLRINQQATVTSDALDTPLSGTVERIRPKIHKQDEIGTDPAARKDARIVEVEILLDNPEPAADLTNLQVDVVFSP